MSNLTTQILVLVPTHGQAIGKHTKVLCHSSVEGMNIRRDVELVYWRSCSCRDCRQSDLESTRNWDERHVSSMGQISCYPAVSKKDSMELSMVVSGVYNVLRRLWSLLMQTSNQAASCLSDIVKGPLISFPIPHYRRQSDFNRTYAWQAVLRCGHDESGWSFKVNWKLEAVIFSRAITFCNTRRQVDRLLIENPRWWVAYFRGRTIGLRFLSIVQQWTFVHCCQFWGNCLGFRVTDNLSLMLSSVSSCLLTLVSTVSSYT